MADQKSAALPLGDAPSAAEGRLGDGRGATLRGRGRPIRAGGPRPTSRDGRPRAWRRPPRPAAGVVEQAEAGRAAAGHARQPAAGRRGKRRQQLADRRQQPRAPAPPDRCGCAAASRGRALPAPARARWPNSSGGTRREHRGGRQRPPRVDQDAVERGQAGHRLEPLADAAHPRRPAAQADRHVAAQLQGRPRPGRRRPAAGARAARGRAASPPRRPSRRRCRTRPAAACRAGSRPRGSMPAALGQRARPRQHDVAVAGGQRRRRTGRRPRPAGSSAGGSVSPSPTSANTTRLSSSW